MDDRALEAARAAYENLLRQDSLNDAERDGDGERVDLNRVWLEGHFDLVEMAGVVLALAGIETGTAETVKQGSVPKG